VPEITAAEWNRFLSAFPDAHILQTTCWAELKTAFGWQPVYVSTTGNDRESIIGAQILFRRFPFGMSVGYIAKGPLYTTLSPNTDLEPAFWCEIDQICKKCHAIFLKVEPDSWESDPPISDRLSMAGFVPDHKNIQPRRTLLIDLQDSEEQILARMKQKTRYNIRLAEKKGVVVQPEDDMGAFYSLMRQTGERDLFGVHTIDYYRRAHALFFASGECILLIARVGDQPVAALMAFRHGKRAWYFYGASSDDHRERMPAYLLQWEAIRWARNNGCLSYDLWGVPDYDEETLETGFLNQSGGLWGVYRFKRGFGGRLFRSVSSQNRVYHPFLYRLYQLWSRSRPQD